MTPAETRIEANLSAWIDRVQVHDRELVAVIHPTVADAQECGEFDWLDPEEAAEVFPGPVGSVWAKSEGGFHTGLPGTVEVPAEYAHLFAASPKLLQACEHALQYLDSVGCEHTPAYRHLELAIALAKGG